MKLALISFSLPAMASLVAYPPELCILTPASTLHAGVSIISATIDGDVAEQCIATMAFATVDFLPITYSFDNFSCPGSHVMSFVAPEDAPNGGARITWQCTGLAPTCNLVTITDGLQRASNDLERPGTVGCVVEAVQTSTKLVTVTGLSGTFVETVPTTFTTATISALTTSTEASTEHSSSTACSGTGTGAGTSPQKAGPTTPYTAETSTPGHHNSLGTGAPRVTGSAGTSPSALLPAETTTLCKPGM
ncbi:hypothetical protein F5Y16DRAFT_253459 [Xylariaceae sp. FL0255]|nr:hypothetical protein F5Y16DRAFT_253459 [Xylariaceae sp. FL0255]